MKRMFFAAVAVMTAMVACNKENPLSPLSGETIEVTLTVDVPTGLQTKAIADGLSATELSYAVYNADKTEYLPRLSGSTPVKVGDKKWTLTLTLVKNYTYNIFFWAQAPGAPYTFDKAAGTVAVNYSGFANDENRDAFCTLYSVTVPRDAKTFSPADPAILTRPFSQINLCATDYEYVSELDLTMKSKISVNGVADTYNFLTGEVSGNASVDFDLAQIPLEKGETISVNGTEYAYVGMNYILAPENTKFNADGTPQQDPKSLTDLGAQFEYNNLTVDVEVPNVPYQRNFRTNIIGNFFTGDATITVQIDEAFEKEDYPVQYN